jgi:hypothetical protein
MSKQAFRPCAQAASDGHKLPLVSFKASVSVEGSVVLGKLEQVFKNPGAAPLEVLYVVPLTESVSLTALRL